VHPINRGIVTLVEDQVLGVFADGVVRIVLDFRAGNDGHPLVEQFDHGADHAGLALATLAQEDDVVPR
jgi:hypothetical protein